jgi:hypothetical protein
MTSSDQSRRPDAEIHDEALAALYRQAAREEPSPRHDAAILAAAAADLAASRAPRRQPWWLRWRLGLSLAATVVLSTSLVLLVQREQNRIPAGGHPAPLKPALRQAPNAEPAPAAPAAEAPSLQRPLAPQRQDEPRAEGRAAASAAPAGPSEQRAASRGAMEAPAKAERGVSAQTPAPAQNSDTGREADRAAAPEPPSPESKLLAPSADDGKLSGKAQETPSAVSPYSIIAPKGSAPPSALPAAAPPPAAPAPFPAPAESSQEKHRSVAAPSARDAPARSPQDELAEIRALLQAGRTEEARNALGAFLRGHPDFVLPADLQALRPPRE